jgi:hypothetical protein
MALRCLAKRGQFTRTEKASVLNGGRGLVPSGENVQAATGALAFELSIDPFSMGTYFRFVFLYQKARRIRAVIMLSILLGGLFTLTRTHRRDPAN